MKDWINLHYAGKKGEIYTEFPEVGEFLVQEIGAKYLDMIETDIGTYFKYSVNNLEDAYRRMLWAFRFIEWR
jgi:hypothetical protein